MAAANQDGIVTQFGYDGAGQLVSVTNASGTASQVVAAAIYSRAFRMNNVL